MRPESRMTIQVYDLSLIHIFLHIAGKELGAAGIDVDFHYPVADFDNLSQQGIADMLYDRGMQILQAKEVRYGAPVKMCIRDRLKPISRWRTLPPPRT